MFSQPQNLRGSVLVLVVLLVGLLLPLHLFQDVGVLDVVGEGVDHRVVPVIYLASVEVVFGVGTRLCSLPDL